MGSIGFIDLFFFKYLDLFRIFSDFRYVVFFNLVSLAACDAEDEIVQGRTSEDVDMVT